MQAWRVALHFFFVLNFAIATTVVVTPQAQAIHPHIRRVLIFGGYGLVLGSVVGLATVPLSQDFRTLFMGSSVGIYVGIALGVYYVIAFDDPGNPFRGVPTGESSGLKLAPRAWSFQGEAPPLLWVQIPVATF